MAFRAKDRKAERGEIELLRGLVTLANQLQSSLELEAIVQRHRDGPQRDLRVPRGDACTCLSRKARRSVFTRLSARTPSTTASSSIVRCRAASGTSSFRCGTRSARPTSSTTVSTRGLTSSSTTCRPSTWGRGVRTSGTRTTTCSCPCTTRSTSSWASSTCTTRRPQPADSRRGQVAGGVRDACRGGHRERAAVPAARVRPRAARGPAGAATRAARPQRGAALDARRARALREDRRAPQGDRRLRRHGDPARGRRGTRAVLRLRQRRGRRADVQLARAAGRRRERLGAAATTRPSSSTTCSPIRAGAGAGHRLGPSGLHHRASQRGRQGHRGAGARPDGRQDVPRQRARVRQAVRQPFRHRHPERALSTRS